MDRLTSFNEWIEKAEKDLAGARMHQGCGTAYEAPAFLCHQAVEKTLKGYLLAMGEDEVPSHDLPYLGRWAAKTLPELESLYKELALVNRYYLEMTYPDDLRYEVSAAIVDECIAIAQRVLNMIRKAADDGRN